MMQSEDQAVNNNTIFGEPFVQGLQNWQLVLQIWSHYMFVLVLIYFFWIKVYFYLLLNTNRPSIESSLYVWCVVGILRELSQSFNGGT